MKFKNINFLSSYVLNSRTNILCFDKIIQQVVLATVKSLIHNTFGSLNEKTKIR